MSARSRTGALRRCLVASLLGLAAVLVGVRPAVGHEPAALPQPATAQVPALTEEELRAIQQSLGAEQPPATAPSASSAPGPVASLLQSMNPDLSLILDTAGAWFSEADPLQTGGHDPRTTGFHIQQLEMHLAANVDPYLRLESNVVFAQFGVEVEEAYATTLALPARLQARAGQFLTRFGRQNPTHLHAWSFLDQPLLLGKFFGSEGSRGAGVELSWLAALPWYVELVASATEAGGACCARSFFGSESLPVRDPGDLLFTGAIKQFFPLGEAWGLSLGLSGQAGPNASGWGNRSRILGTDLYLRRRPPDAPGHEAFTVQVEAMWRQRQVPGDVLDDWGMYAQVLWHDALQWQYGVRQEYVSGLEGDPLDPSWTTGRARTSAVLSFLPSHFSRLRLQAGRGETADGRAVWSAMLGLEVLIGAHGAHDW